MPDFSFIARTEDGKRKEGSITASNINEASNNLSAQNLTVVKLTERDTSFDFAGPFLDRLSLKLEKLKTRVPLKTIVFFTRQLSTMFAAGVPMVEAMDSVAGSTGNRLFENATLQIKDDISKGVQLNTSMLTSQRFPSMVVQMTKIGEESGRLEEMLNKVADYFEEQVDDLVDTLSKQIEPMVMAVLGVIVGGLVIAMYLPIFKLGAVVG